jgi:hypothetical protein
MKPDVWMQPNVPRTVADFAIDWPSLVKQVVPYAEADLRYLATTAEYCNNGGMPDGIVALHAELTKSDELLRALHNAHHLQHIAASLAAHLLARTSFAAALTRFDADADKLFARVEEAKFEALSPFLLEGTLALDLYLYGMYRHFWQTRSPNEARDIARDLVAQTVGADLEGVLVLTTRMAWGDWFDVHSCSDRSWLLIDGKAARAFALTFSHSD